LKTIIYKGVHWKKDKQKWAAEIKKNYRKHRLGYFDIEEDAACAYNEAALELFGEFARLNELPERSDQNENRQLELTEF
jgi:hypothetical protein